MLVRETINPEGLPEPIGFSHGIATRGGRIIWIAGQNGTDADGQVVAGGLVEQTDHALGNVIAVVKGAGGQATDIVKLHFYVSDVAEYRTSRRELGAVWRKHFGRHFPAMMLLGVTGFYEEDAVIEIDGFAVIHDPTIQQQGADETAEPNL